MLVLSRKQQEQIKIGDQITVTIVRVKGNTVRVGIEAPRDVRVVRSELPKADAEPAGTTATVDSTTAASDVTLQHSDGLPSGSVLSFRVRCESEIEPTPVPAAHLPLKRVHDRFGEAPLKQLLASCATLAK
jgi:carbon storage regulator